MDYDKENKKKEKLEDEIEQAEAKKKLLVQKITKETMKKVA